jgi:hypothetical protein
VSDDAGDELWRVAPDAFVGVRDGLAKALRADGRTDEANEVKALKKPSLALWAVNQLAVGRPRVVQDLVELGTQVEAATADAMRGEGAGAVRELDRQRRHAVSDATTAAADLAAAAGHQLSPAMLARVTSTLDNAVLTQATRDLLQAGRLPSELDAPGFGGLESLDLGPPAARREEQAVRDERERRRVEERAAERVRRAEAEADRLEAVATEAEAVATVARQRAVEARQRADAARAEG